MPTYAQWFKKSGKWGHLWRTRHPKKLSGFSILRCAMYNVRQRTSGPSMSLSRCLWPVVWLWQDGSKHWLLEIEFPKNSLFKSDKWAPAPPGDWYTRGQVRSVTACSIHSWHVQVYISSHGTHLHVNHAILICTKFTHGLHPLLFGAHAGPPSTGNNADNSLWHASDAKKHVSGWIHLVWILGKAKSIPEWVYLQS